MNVSQDGKGMDYVDYFVNQLPRDLASLAQLRDELKQRQGAMTAVEDANQLRADAEAIRKQAERELADARAEARDVLDKTNEKLVEAEALGAANDAAAKELAQKSADFDKSVAAKIKELSDRESFLNRVQADLEKREAVIEDNLAALKAGQDDLANRVKSFQDKVAALNA